MNRPLPPYNSYNEYKEHCLSDQEAMRRFYRRERRTSWYKLPKWVVVLAGIIAAVAIGYVLMMLWMAL